MQLKGVYYKLGFKFLKNVGQTFRRPEKYILWSEALILHHLRNLVNNHLSRLLV